MTAARLKTPLSALLVLSLLVPPTARVAVAQTTEADVFVAQAIIDFDEKRYDDAMANLRRALEIEPDNVDALYYSGVVVMAQNRSQDAVPFLEKARQKAPGNTAVAFQLGLAYFALQQYDKAQPLLEEAFRADPTRDGLGYYVGFMRYRNKDYRGALNAFRAGRASSPEIQQLTAFYASLALGILGLPAQASAEVERALRLAPGSELTGPAERLRDTLVAARGKEHRLSLEARLGVFYDDNVAVIPNASNDPLVQQLRGQDKESFGELGALNAAYTFLRTEAWEGSANIALFATYNNDLPEFNIIDALGGLAIARKTSLGRMPAQVGAQYAFDTLFLDQEEFIQRHTASLVGILVESDRHLSQVFTRYQRKDFNETTPTLADEIRDANNWAVGFVHLLRFAQDRHFLKAGYQFDYERTDGKNYRYSGNRILAGGQYTLPWKGVRLKYDFDVHFRDYLHNNSLVEAGVLTGSRRRGDTEFTNIARAELPLPHSLTLAAEYQSTINNSNIDVFEYTRNVYSLIVSWTY